MTLCVLDFLEASPDAWLDESADPSPTVDFFPPFVDCVLSPTNSIRQRATDVANRLFANFYRSPREADTKTRFIDRGLRKRLWGRRYVRVYSDHRLLLSCIFLAPTCSWVFARL